MTATGLRGTLGKALSKNRIVTENQQGIAQRPRVALLGDDAVDAVLDGLGRPAVGKTTEGTPACFASRTTLGNDSPALTEGHT
jgi:hypothetical protein